MGANSNAWDSRLAQRHTSTCKRAKSTESSVSAHELSLVMQALGNLNSVALDTFTHESPPTIKASKVLSEDHSFCKRLKPRTRAPLFVNGSIPMRQARPGKIDCQPSREGSCLVRRPLRCGDERSSKKSQTRPRSHCVGATPARDSSHQKGCRLGHGRAGVGATPAWRLIPSKKPQAPVGNLRPHRAHELAATSLTTGWRRPCRAPRSRRGGTAGWRRGREGSPDR